MDHKKTSTIITSTPVDHTKYKIFNYGIMYSTKVKNTTFVFKNRTRINSPNFENLEIPRKSWTILTSTPMDHKKTEYIFNYSYDEFAKLENSTLILKNGRKTNGSDYKKSSTIITLTPIDDHKKDKRRFHYSLNDSTKVKNTTFVFKNRTRINSPNFENLEIPRKSWTILTSTPMDHKKTECIFNYSYDDFTKLENSTLILKNGSKTNGRDYKKTSTIITSIPKDHSEYKRILHYGMDEYIFNCTFDDLNKYENSVFICDNECKINIITNVSPAQINPTKDESIFNNNFHSSTKLEIPRILKNRSKMNLKKIDLCNEETEKIMEKYFYENNAGVHSITQNPNIDSAAFVDLDINNRNIMGESEITKEVFHKLLYKNDYLDNTEEHQSHKPTVASLEFQDISSQKTWCWSPNFFLSGSDSYGLGKQMLDGNRLGFISIRNDLSNNINTQTRHKHSNVLNPEDNYHLFEFNLDMKKRSEIIHFHKNSVSDLHFKEKRAVSNSQLHAPNWDIEAKTCGVWNSDLTNFFYYGKNPDINYFNERGNEPKMKTKVPHGMLRTSIVKNSTAIIEPEIPPQTLHRITTSNVKTSTVIEPEMQPTVLNRMVTRSQVKTSTAIEPQIDLQPPKVLNRMVTRSQVKTGTAIEPQIDLQPPKVLNRMVTRSQVKASTALEPQIPKIEPPLPPEEPKINFGIEILLKFFDIDNNLSKNILLALQNTNVVKGMTVTEILKYLKENSTFKTVTNIKQDVKAFLNTAISANILKKKGSRYILTERIESTKPKTNSK